MKTLFWLFLAFLSFGAQFASAQNSGNSGGSQPFDNRQPTLALRYIICTNGIFPSLGNPGIGPVDRTEAMHGEIRTIAFNAQLPRNWLECNGQVLNIAGNTALFSTLGTTFGGNGRSTFQLPDLRGRVPIGASPEPESPYQLGGVYGTEALTLTIANLPQHAHSIPGNETGITGGGLPFDNLQPALALNFLITQNGEIMIFPGNFAPDGWGFCNGSALAIADYETLFSYIGTTYGGDGQNTFNLPDLTGRTPIGSGQGPGLEPYYLGQSLGEEKVTLTQAEMPAHAHGFNGGFTGVSGQSLPFPNIQPSLTLNWLICTAGIYPSGGGSVFPWISEMRLVAGANYSLGSNWLPAQGQALPIEVYDALFTLIGTMYGGDGQETFNLPDTRGRASVSHGQAPGLSSYILAETAGSETRTLTVTQMPTHSHIVPFAPILICPQNIITNSISGECIQNINISASVEGNPAPTVTYKVGTKPITFPRNFPVGTNTVTVTATNGVEPNAQCTFDIIVLDTQAPVMNCPSPITVTSDGGNCPKVVTYTSSASDCALANSYSVPASGTAFPVGTNLVTTYAVDTFGNSNSCTFTVTVLPGPQPQLSIVRAGTNVVLSWPGTFGCYVLQSAAVLSTTSNTWNAVATSPSLSAGNYYLTNAPSTTNRFFRLRY